MAQLLGSSIKSCLPPASCPPAILIADDQPDLLDALRLLLKPEGIAVDAVHSPEAALAAVQTTPVRSRADGSELHRRHDVGPRRDRPPGARAGARRHAAGRRDDRLGLGRPRGRGHAPRRARLRPEALGQRSARRDCCAPRSRQAASGARSAQREAARARRSAAHPAHAAAGDAAADRTASSSPASWQPASGVGGDCFDAIRFSPQPRSRCRSPTWSARAFPRRC